MGGLTFFKIAFGGKKKVKKGLVNLITLFHLQYHSIIKEIQ